METYSKDDWQTLGKSPLIARNSRISQVVPQHGSVLGFGGLVHVLKMYSLGRLSSQPMTSLESSTAGNHTSKSPSSQIILTRFGHPFRPLTTGGSMGTPQWWNTGCLILVSSQGSENCVESVLLVRKVPLRIFREALQNVPRIPQILLVRVKDIPNIGIPRSINGF